MHLITQVIHAQNKGFPRQAEVSNNDEMYKLRFGWGKVLGFC